MRAMQQEAGWGGASADRQPPLPAIDGWIESSRTARYRGPALAERWQLNPAQFYLFHETLCQDAQHWLNEVRLWDAAPLLCAGYAEAEIEAALVIRDGPAFWKRFEKYHGCPPSELIARCRRRQEDAAMKRAEWADVIGWENIPDEFMAPSWMKALRNLTPHDPRGGAIPFPASTGPLAFAGCLHGHVVEGREEAREAVAGLTIERLRARLEDAWPKTDEHISAQAAHQALLDYLAKPSDFNPRGSRNYPAECDSNDGRAALRRRLAKRSFAVSNRRADLGSFLYKLAWRNVRNICRSENRRPDREPLPEDEQWPNSLASASCVPSPADRLMEQEAEAERDQEKERRLHRLEQFMRKCSAQDRQILELRGKGERRFRPYAQILGITALPEAEQRRKVNQAKNRLLHALRRWMRLA